MANALRFDAALVARPRLPLEREERGLPRKRNSVAATTAVEIHYGWCWDDEFHDGTCGG